VQQRADGHPGQPSIVEIAAEPSCQQASQAAGEYNRSIPGVLKNAIDFLYHEWTNKAAGFVSYGADAGGARAVEHLRVVLGELHIADVRTMVQRSLTQDFENFSDFTPTETAVKKADEMLEQLAAWARALRTARQERAVVA
jgi:NAD(P)H-dependent FMN reductase